MRKVNFFYQEKFHFRGSNYELVVPKRAGYPGFFTINDHVFHWKCWPEDVPQENDPCIVMAYFDGFGDALIYGRMTGGIWISMSPVFPIDGSHYKHPIDRKKRWYPVKWVEDSFKEDF